MLPPSLRIRSCDVRQRRGALEASCLAAPSHSRSFPLWAIVAAGLVVLMPPAHAESEPLEVAQQAAADWLKFRTESVRLETQWRTEKSLMESTVKALEERAGLAEEKRENIKARTAAERTDLESIQSKSRAAAAELEGAAGRLSALTGRLVALRPQLPPRLSDALEMSYRSLANSQLPPAEKMQLCMVVLNRCVQFNQQVTAADDMLTMPGRPTPKLYRVLYWGLSHGYAFDPATRQSWLGRPGASGWAWQEQPDASDAVDALIEIQQGKRDPRTVAVIAQLAQVAPPSTR